MTDGPIDAGADRARRFKTLVTVALVLVLLSPSVRNGDGVPLSSYPMYATPRPHALEFVVPVGVTGEGIPQSLSMQTVAATRDPLVAETYLRRQVASGRAAMLCKEVAGRVSSRAIETVEVWIEVHNVVERATGQDSLIDRRRAASCPA